MEQASEFILVYNRLCDYLRQLTGGDTNWDFPLLLQKASDKNAGVRKYKDMLQAYNRLRNAIIHWKDYPDKIIATPLEEEVVRFRQVVDSVCTPKRVIPMFQKQVQVFETSEKLSVALRYMKQEDYSQVVVRAQGKHVLITVEGIARWLESQVENELVDIESATLGDILPCDTSLSFIFMDRNCSVYDAEAAFGETIGRNRPRLLAIIVTHNGRPTETPLGIVTPWDLIPGSFSASLQTA